MSIKNSYSSSSVIINQENIANLQKKNQNSQNEAKQTNTIILQKIAARLTRVEEKFSHFPVIENYRQNNKIATSTLEEKFKFIEIAGEKLNNQLQNTDRSFISSVEDSVLMIEKQLFNDNSFEKDNLRNRILRIGSFQESNYKVIKQNINNLILDTDVSIEFMKQTLTVILNNMNKQAQIPNNDFNDIETLKFITKVAYSPQSSIEMLRDSLKKSLKIQQNSQTKILELQRKTQYLEEQVRIAAEASKQQASSNDDSSLFTEQYDFTANYPKYSTLNRTVLKPASSYQPSNAWSPKPRKSRTFDLDDDSEMDSFALREAFEPEIKEQFQDHLEMMNSQLRNQGLSMREIETTNEIFKNCFIDLRSKILVQQDTISSLEKDKMQAISIRDKMNQQEAKIRMLQAAMKESIKENPEYKKQLKTIQLLTIKLNQAKNKIVFNQENMTKMKSQLQEKEDQRKRYETENFNLKKDLTTIQQAFEMSNIDTENMKSLEYQAKNIKSLFENLKKTEKQCEIQQERMFNMHNLIIKLRNQLNSNGIQTPNDHEIEMYIQSTTQKQSPTNEPNNERSIFNINPNDQNSIQKNYNSNNSNDINIPQDSINFDSKAYSNNNNRDVSLTSEFNKESINRNILNNNGNTNNGNSSNNNDISNNGNSSNNNDISNNGNSSNNNLNNNDNASNNNLNNNDNASNNNLNNNGNTSNNNMSNNNNYSITKENNKSYQDEIQLLNQRIQELENDNQKLQQISYKQVSQFHNFNDKINKLQTKSETKLTLITKKIKEIGDGYRNFISIHNNLGNSSPKDRKTIEELSQLLHIANNTITTLSKEKDSLLNILYSETNNSKFSDDKIHKIDLAKNSSTDRFQLNLQQIDEQVTCNIDSVKNVKSSILNDNQKESH
ncbi:hypothetical protein M9Y10_004802 [Tritrichomonas musculus]|uniref:Uncharacterized protein n=1 Tax=Tritrichomonas musculus TaxID=1915356 RepID=A0ABR2JK42_9EUKA